RSQIFTLSLHDALPISAFSVLSLPLQYTVDYPLRIFGWVQALISAKSSLIKQNIRLRYQQTMLEAELQRLMAIQEENADLKALRSEEHTSELQSRGHLV